MSEDLLKIEKLSAEVLRLSRNTILINLRFMDAALAELALMPSLEMRGIATDGTNLVYNPMDILRAYALIIVGAYVSIIILSFRFFMFYQ
jgi:hypothetical protein